MSQNTMKPTRLPSRGMVVLMIAVMLAAGGGLVWWFTSGSDSLEPKSTNSADYAFPEGKPLVETPFGPPQDMFLEVILQPQVPTSTWGECSYVEVTFTGQRVSETIKNGGVTFNRTTGRTVVDVPGEIFVRALVVNDDYTSLPHARGFAKTTFVLPEETWGVIDDIGVCS